MRPVMVTGTGERIGVWRCVFIVCATIVAAVCYAFAMIFATAVWIWEKAKR